VHVHTSYKPQGNGITLHLENHGAFAVDVRITDIYTGSVHTVHLKAGETVTKYSERNQTFGWYDFVVEVESDSTFVWQLAGHVETGKESRTDPAIAAV
jgi:phospholipase C